MAMQRIGRHHAAFELQKFEQLQGASGLVVVRCQYIGERHARLRRPSGHHHRRHVALAAFVAAPQRFAVERDHPARPLDLRALRKGFHEAPKRDFKRFRVKHPEHPAERVVARQTVLELQHILPKIGLHPGKQRHVGATRRPAQRRHQRDEQDLGQVMQRVVGPRVRQLRKALRKSLHRLLSPYQEPPESLSADLATTCRRAHAIPPLVWEVAKCVSSQLWCRAPRGSRVFGRGHCARIRPVKPAKQKHHRTLFEKCWLMANAST
jgi:hypothetical protein